MKRIVLLALSLLCLTANAQTMLQGGIIEKVKVDEARDAAFDKLPTRLDMNRYPRLDPDMLMTIQARVRHQECFPDRQIHYFSDGSYGITINGEYEGRYYFPNGSLQKIEIRSKPVGFFKTEGLAGYPVRTSEYLYPSGNLFETRMAVAPYEDYSFTPDGRLASYCLGNTCYRPNGQIFGYRSVASICEQTEAKVQN